MEFVLTLAYFMSRRDESAVEMYFSAAGCGEEKGVMDIRFDL